MRQRRLCHRPNGGSAAQHTTADPALLSVLAHYARQRDDVQQTRIALEHRLGAMQRDGLAEPWMLPIVAAARDLAATERAIDRQLSRLVGQLPIGAWTQQTPGLGPVSVARLLGVTGSLDRFPDVGKLWAYLGLHVVDGAAPRRRSGQRAPWSAQGRVVCHVLGMSIVRIRRGRYRAAYDRKKAEYLARPRCGPSACPFGQTHLTRRGDVVQCSRMHVHLAARRYAVKQLLRDLWRAWQAHIPKEATT